MHFLVIIIALILLGAFWPLILRGALIVGGLVVALGVAGGALFAVLCVGALAINAVWSQPKAGTQATVAVTPIPDPRYPAQAAAAPTPAGANPYDPHRDDDPDRPLPADLVRPGCVKLLDTITKPDCYQLRSR